MKHFRSQKGFTFLEIVITLGIAVMLFGLVFSFGQSIFRFNSSVGADLNAQTSARKVLKTMVKELREASPSSLGAYPIALASTTAITFFSNVDADPLKEQIRYFIQNNELKRGVLKPTGTPLVYVAANEQVTTLITDVVASTTVFQYFDSNYAGTTTPLTQPVMVNVVRLIRITVDIEKDPNRSPAPITVTSQVFVRNLKDNL